VTQLVCLKHRNFSRNGVFLLQTESAAYYVFSRNGVLARTFLIRLKNGVISNGILSND